MNGTNHNLSVILLDDEVLELEMSVRRLERIGIAVKRTFEFAPSLYDYLKHTKIEDYPTAVLVDYVMPETSGEKVVKDLRYKFPMLPIIILSGKDMHGSVRSYGLGAYAVMQKPFDVNELSATLLELDRLDKASNKIAGDLRQITGFDCCIVWELDKNDYPNYRISGFDGIDRNFAKDKTMSAAKYRRLNEIQAERPLFIDKILGHPLYTDQKLAEERGWVSLVCLPFFQDGRLSGWMDCYKYTEHRFETERQKEHQLQSWQNFARLGGEVLRAGRTKRYARIIHETNQNLSTILDEKILNDTILEKAIQTTGADSAVIYRHERAKKILKPISAEGIPLKEVEVILPPSNHEFDLFMSGDRSEIRLPIGSGKRLLGILMLKSRHPGFFFEDEIQFFFSLAAVIAVSMERSKLNHYLQGVSQKAQEANRFLDLADYVVNAVHDLTDADVTLWTKSREENEGDNFIRAISASNVDYMKLLKPVPITAGASLSAIALENDALVIKDLTTYKGPPPIINQEIVELEDLRSLMIVPLIGTDREKIGVIILLSKEQHKFTPEEGHVIRHFANHAALALQELAHIRILEELGQIGRQLTVNRADEKELLGKVAGLSLKIARAEFAVLYPYDNARKEYYDVDHIAYAGKLRQQDKVFNDRPRKDGLAAFIREHGVLIVEEIDKDARTVKAYTRFRNRKELQSGKVQSDLIAALVHSSNFIRKENIRAFIGVSLHAEVQGKNTDSEVVEVAVLYFNFRKPRNFSEEELKVIDIFCRQVANIIYRNRLFYALEKQREALEAVYNSALHISKERNSKTRLKKIVAEAVDLLKAKGGKMYLVETENKKQFRLVASQNVPVRNMKVGEIVPFGQGIVSIVFSKKEPVIENNYAKHPNHIPRLKDFFSKVVEVPMVLDREIIGVLGVFNDRQNRDFTDEDADVLKKFAAQASLSIYNDRLYGELDALYETGLQIAKQTDIKGMARRILSELKKVVDYDSACLQRIPNMESRREVLAWAGLDRASQSPELLRPIVTDPLVHEIIRGNSSGIISDVQTEHLWIPNKATDDIKSWACLPLNYGGKTLGIMTLEHKTPGYYTESDRPKLGRFALQAAIGLHNASQEQTQLRLLNEFAEDINLYDDKTALLDGASMIIATAFKAPKVIFYVKDQTYFPLSLARGKYQKMQVKTYHSGKKMTHLYIWEQKNSNTVELVEAPGTGRNFMLGPLWKEGTICAVVEVICHTSTSDKNTRNFFSSMLTLISQQLYGLEVRQRKVEALKSRFNPYKAGDPITDHNEFYGREEIIRKILNGIRNNSFLIESERRIGKTSLLHQIKFHLSEQPDSKVFYYPVFMDMEGTPEGDLWKHLRNRMYSLSGKNYPDPKTGYDFWDLQEDLAKFLAELNKVHTDKAVRLVFLIDEMDAFVLYSEDTLAKLRNILQGEPRLKTVFAGVDFAQSLTSLTSPLRNQFVPLGLGAFSDENARNLIMGPVKGYYTYTNKAVDMILQDSHRKPYLIQKICWGAVESMLDRLDRDADNGMASIVITEDDVQKTKN